MDQIAAKLYTIGHSTHSYERFIQLLRGHGVTFVLDVRSLPHSGRAPQFSQRPLREALRADGIRYRHAGNILGGRPADRQFYEEDQVQYDRIAAFDEFRKALVRVRSAARTHRVGLMCAEGDPLTCHRFLLLARSLRSPELDIVHILPDGRGEPQTETELRLMRQTGLLQSDLFAKNPQALEEAYDIQSRRVAFAARRIETSSEEGAR